MIRVRTLKDAIGPNSRVTGSITRLGPGAVVTQARFIPVGAHTAVVSSGFEPHENARAHHSSDQTNTEPSTVAVVRIRCVKSLRTFGSITESHRTANTERAATCCTPGRHRKDPISVRGAGDGRRSEWSWGRSASGLVVGEWEEGPGVVRPSVRRPATVPGQTAPTGTSRSSVG